MPAINGTSSKILAAIARGDEGVFENYMQQLRALLNNSGENEKSCWINLKKLVKDLINEQNISNTRNI